MTAGIEAPATAAVVGPWIQPDRVPFLARVLSYSARWGVPESVQAGTRGRAPSLPVSKV